jgi:uncharacterized protein (UPF0212 family)
MSKATTVNLNFKANFIEAVDAYYTVVHRTLPGRVRSATEEALLAAVEAAQEMLNEMDVVKFEDYGYTTCYWGDQNGQPYCITHDQGFPCPHAKS